MADKYVVAAGGNWSAAATWSLTDGGAGGAGAPSAAENAFLSNQSGNLVVDAGGLVCLDLDFTKGTGYTGTFSGSPAIVVSGSLKLNGAMTRTFTGQITFNATAVGKTLTLNGVALASALTFSGIGGGWTLQDALNIGTAALTQSAGSLDTNGKAVTCATFNNSATATLTLGASVITCTSWQVQSTTTFSGAASTINATPTAIGFAGGGKTYGIVSVTANQTTATPITGANTFTTLTLLNDASKVRMIALGADQVTGTFKYLGNSVVNHPCIQSDVLGTPRTITATTIDAASNFCDFQDITGAGAAAPFATGTSIGNCGGNSGITATTSATQTSTGTASFTWSTHGWTSRVPLPQDDVVISNAFIAGRTITLDMPRMGKNVTFSCTGSPLLSSTQATLLGNLVMAAGMTTSGAQPIYFGARSAVTLQSNGVVFAQSIRSGVVAGVNNSLTLLDAFSSTAALSFGAATGINDGGFSVTALSFTALAASVSVVMNSTWTLTGSGSAWNNGSAGSVTVGSSSVLKFTDATVSLKTFAGGGKTYNNLWFSGVGLGLYTISGSNTFNQVKVDPGLNVLPVAGTTQTAADWQVSGATATASDRKYLRLFGVAGSNATTPDTAANSITSSSLQMVVCIAPDNWGNAGNVLSKRAASNQVSFNLQINGAGGLTLVFSTDGSTTVTVNSSVATGFGAMVAFWVMVTRDPTTGDVKFWTSADPISTAIGSVSWTQLGATVTAATGNIFDSTSIIEVGSIITGGAVAPYTGRIYRAAIYNAIAGAIVCDFNPEDHSSGSTHASATGETWTRNGASPIGKTNCTLLASLSAASFTVAKSGGGKVKATNLAVSRSTASPVNTFYAFNTGIDSDNNVNWRFYNPDYTLAAAVGAFVLSGKPVALKCARLLRGGTGAFVLSGKAINFIRPLVLRAAVGNFSLVGNPANLFKTADDPNYHVVADGRDFTVTADGRDFTIRRD